MTPASIWIWRSARRCSSSRRRALKHLGGGGWCAGVVFEGVWDGGGRGDGGPGAGLGGPEVCPVAEGRRAGAGASRPPARVGRQPAPGVVGVPVRRPRRGVQLRLQREGGRCGCARADPRTHLCSAATNSCAGKDSTDACSGVTAPRMRTPRAQGTEGGDMAAIRLPLARWLLADEALCGLCVSAGAPRRLITPASNEASVRPTYKRLNRPSAKQKSRDRSVVRHVSILARLAAHVTPIGPRFLLNPFASAAGHRSATAAAAMRVCARVRARPVALADCVPMLPAQPIASPASKPPRSLFRPATAHVDAVALHRLHQASGAAGRAGCTDSAPLGPTPACARSRLQRCLHLARDQSSMYS